MRGAKPALLVMVIIGLGLSVAGCREEEQGRPLVSEKGVYEGQPDEELDEQQLMELRSRAAGQQF